MRIIFTRPGAYPIQQVVSTSQPVLPPNYRTVLDVVQQAGHGNHLTAQEIWLRARALQPRMGFATVHRGLIRLAELGAVLKIDVPGEACAVYEPMASPHAHFRCTSCRRIQDLAFALSPAMLRELGERHGVAIEREAVTFSGRCRTCS